MYNYVDEEQYDNKFLSFQNIRYVETNHSDELSCYGLLFTTTAAISSLITKNSGKNIDKIYIDTPTANFPGNVHLYIGILQEQIPKEFKSKVFCMHINNDQSIKEAKNVGFNVVETQKDTPFPIHTLDGHAESYTVSSYTDNARASYLQKQIATLKSQINSYSRDAETIRKVQQRKEMEDYEEAKANIVTYAHGLYAEKIDAYMELNFWGKAKALFHGKKPKKLTDQQVIQEYGDQAIDKILAPGVEKHNADKEYQIEKAKKEYANNPEELAKVIEGIEQYYNKQYEDARGYYKPIVDSLKEDGRSR